ncbi:hypothetical protein H257_15249 [Aphanomyces astaci]|uniref:Uncharacterized protein n=1 Tax=Aphanomyces astaci TaxID=112090 RepID=W4FN16_APHAT|nr:hypothetical protein H257_15249 [Aphanomyces astaci]ETV68902.1 hypothetical protein H257_15249 [Aphanomyces astaci]RQM21367.1 hypothetical protein B5M09_009844 [Aphanomyces astaci]|eukprot:XP_009841579.1 hypothetical protein H257_15249 [Aphanomyces astaci]
MDTSLAAFESCQHASLTASPWTVPVTFCLAVSVLLSYLFPFLVSKPPPTNRRLKRRLTTTGLTTLLTETDTNLSILFTITVLDKIVSKETLVAQLRSRLEPAFFVRFRSRVVGRDFCLVEDFDVADHITVHQLDTSQDVHEYAETLNNVPLDMAMPLWKLHMVHVNDQTFLLWRLHHCLGDGQSMSMFFLKVCDNGYAVLEKLATHALAPPKKPSDGRRHHTSIWRSISIQCIHVLETVGLVLWSIALYMRKIVCMMCIAESSQYFKQPGHTTKRLSYSLALTVTDTKALGKHMAASINDVMLSCVAGALKHMLPETDRHHPRMFLRAAIPINMRSVYDPFLTTSNAFSSLLIDLPVGEPNRIKRTEMVVQAMAEAKTSLERVFTLGLTKIMAALPVAVMLPISRMFTSRVSVAITNVRGPSDELYLGGAKIVQSIGFLPPPPSVNVGIAITSIGNTLGVTVATDKSIDAPKLMAAIEAEFIALQASCAAILTADDKKHV